LRNKNVTIVENDEQKCINRFYIWAQNAEMSTDNLCSRRRNVDRCRSWPIPRLWSCRRRTVSRTAETATAAVVRLESYCTDRRLLYTQGEVTSHNQRSRYDRHFVDWTGKSSPYLIAECRVPGWSRFFAVSLQATWVINPTIRQLLIKVLLKEEAIKWWLTFPPRLLIASALPRETRTQKLQLFV